MNTFIEIPANNISIAGRKLVFGVGINDANYMVTTPVNGKQLKCPYYKKWSGMLVRCYSTKYHKTRPTYIGCTVAPEWLTFTNFKKWMKTQDWQGNELDKDLLVQGNKVYSPDTCLFIPRAINLLLTDCKAARGDWPAGVSFHKRVGKFLAKCKANGKRKHLGYHDTSAAAYKAYKQFKYKHIKSIALTQPEPIRSALLAYIILD